MPPLSITDSIVEQLRIHIIVGVLNPGQKLNEVRLSSQLGISRPPLREAFRVLENEKLVASVSRKGSCVSEVSLKDCQEVFEVREILECAAIDLLKAKGVKILPEAVLALEKATDLPIPTASDPHKRFQYLMAVDGFHLKLVASAGNSRLMHLYNSLFACMARYQAMYMYQARLVNKANKVHEKILNSIQKADYTMAKSLLSAHIFGFLDLMKKKMSVKPS